MHIVRHVALQSARTGRERLLVVACARLGVSAFEVALEAIAPGACTPALSHAGELVALVLEGAGKLLIDGGAQRLHAPCTLLIPPGVHFQLVNAGLGELRLVWVYTCAPERAAAGADGPLAPSADATRAPGS